MRYLVTGATGFIGGRVARLLREAGHEVRALVRSRAKPESQALEKEGIALVDGDIVDRASLTPAMAGVDGVFHLAAWYKVGAKDKEVARAINVTGTRNVLETMRDLRVPKGVYTSTLAVFGDTHGKVVDERYRPEWPYVSEYDRTKGEAHFEVALPLMQAGLRLVVVQPGLNYGPGDTSQVRDIWIQYLTRKLPAVPKGVAYCWAHVEDTARAHVLAMQKGRPGECYIAAGPAHTLDEAFAIAEKITGVKPPRLHMGPTMLKAMAAVSSLFERVMDVPEQMASETLRVSAGVTYLGTSAKAQKELGFTARPLEEGLRETLLHEMKLLGLPLPATATAAPAGS